jgi:hypothetical protein
VAGTSQDVGVGKSTRREAFAAGAEAARQAVAGLGGARPGLVLAFGTTGHDQQELLDGIRSVTGDSPLSGCSGEGVITRAGADERSHAVAVMALASPAMTFRTALVTGVARDPRAAARALAGQLESGAAGGRLLLLFVDGVTIDCGALLEELDSHLDMRGHIAGGTAGTELGSFSGWVTHQYHQGQAYSDSVSAVLIGGEVEADIAVSHGCQPLGVELTVTRSDGALVSQLDGRPAFEVVKEYLDGDATDLSANDDLHLVVGLPLPADLQAGYGEILIRAPIRLEPASGALFFTGGGLQEGRRIQLVRRDVEQMRTSAETAGRAMAGRHPDQAPVLVLQFDCTGRGQALCGDQATALTVEPLLRAFPAAVPWVGFHTFGEIGPLGGATVYHACTVVLCGLYPRPGRP